MIISAFALSSCETKNEITSLTVDKSDMSLNVGETDSMLVTIIMTGDINTVSINHTNTNPSVVSIEESSTETSQSRSSSSNSNTISKTYLITGTEAGTTVLTFKSGEKSYSCNITVNEIVDSSSDLSLNMAKYNLTIGEVDSVIVTLSHTANLSASSIEFNIANTAIIEVQESANKEVTTGTDEIISTSKTYIITANSAGTTKLVFQSGEIKDSCEITVTDQIHPTFTQAELWFWGDAYESELSNNFTLYLGSEGIDMEDLSGEGEVLFLELNTDLSITNNIPAGTYEMAELDVTKFLPFTLVPEFIDGEDLWGTWYFGKTTNGIESGNAVVSIENNIYKIVYTLVDYYGNTISGTFNGAISYYDPTQDYVKSSIKSFSKTKTNKKKIQLKRSLK
jgi:hypothetical protein